MVSWQMGFADACATLFRPFVMLPEQDIESANDNQEDAPGNRKIGGQKHRLPKNMPYGKNQGK